MKGGDKFNLVLWHDINDLRCFRNIFHDLFHKNFPREIKTTFTSPLINNFSCFPTSQADKEKKVKKKKAKEEGSAAESAAETAAETPASAATPADSNRGSTRGSGSRRAKKAPSSVFVLFSQKQIAEFKGLYEIENYVISIQMSFWKL